MVELEVKVAKKKFANPFGGSLLHQPNALEAVACLTD